MVSEESSSVVFTGGNLAEADVVRGLLVANGILAVIQDEGAVAMLDGMVSGNKGVSVMVPASALEAARAVLEEARALGRIEPSEEPDTE
jgi:hypothetical protein